MDEEFEIMSDKKYKLLSGLIINNLFLVDDNTWEGEAENGEIYLLIRFNKILVEFDVQELKDNLGTMKRVVVAYKGDNFNIYDLCDFMNWKYNKDQIVD